MNATLNYKALVQELRNRLACTCRGRDDGAGGTWDEFRCRLACMLEEDPQASLEFLLDRLAEKWKRDGLM